MIKQIFAYTQQLTSINFFNAIITKNLKRFFMPKQRLLVPFLIVILIFISFIAIHPLAKLLPTKEHIDYTLKTPGMNNHHHPPLFYLQDNGLFFVHPALEINATGVFTFKKNSELLLHFSIQKGSPVGNMLFVVKKNNIFDNKFLVNVKNDIHYRLKVNANDKITIIADPLGATSGDWGNLEVKQYEPRYIFKLRLIPFLWAIFFIYLMGKGHFYIALNSYIGFLLTLIAEKVTFGPLSYSDTIGYTLLFFFLGLLFTLIYQELRFLKKFKIATLISWLATIVIYFIPIAFITFALVFGKPINWDILFAIYQTNPNEAVEYLQSFIPMQYLLSALAITLLIGYLLWRQELKEKKRIERSLLIFFIALLGSILSYTLPNIRIPHLIFDSLSQYNADLHRLVEFQENHRKLTKNYRATKKEKQETYVVIIGESLNKYNIGLYGHFRNTTPLLENAKKDNLHLFNNAYSNAGNTMQVLSYALTEANQYNKKKYYNSPSFIDIFNKAGFDTYWLARQEILDPNVVSILAHGAKHSIDLVNKFNADRNSTAYEDAKVIQSFQKYLTQSRNSGKNRLFIIHLYGNHFKYSDRYPKEFSKFPTAKPYILGTNNRAIVGDYSEYDNSIYFNDYVVNSLLQILKKEDGISTLLYFSDHGEDIGRHLGHTSRLESFTYEMTQIPLLAWFSQEYIDRYPQKYNTLLSHANSLFSNDMIYDTIIGLANIKTNHYSPTYDLSSPKYKLNPKDALTLHGKKRYTASDNYIYWREYNAKLLKGKSFYPKLVANDTDSVAKLNEAWNLGFRAFKLNLYYMADKKSFQAGTDKYDTGGNLIDTLSYFKKDKIEHLILHLANLSKDNLNAILERLNTIKSKLPSKEKITLLIENSNFIKALKAKGWRVALKSSQLIQSGADSLMINAKGINKEQIKNSSTSLIINHAFNLADSKLEKKLNSLEYLNSSNIGALLVDFKSEFKW